MGIAKVMIKMPVGCQQVSRMQTVVPDIAVQCIEFLLIVGTTVNDDALTGVVADHVTVFLQRVAHQTFYGEHIAESIFYFLLDGLALIAHAVYGGDQIDITTLWLCIRQLKVGVGGNGNNL